MGLLSNIARNVKVVVRKYSLSPYGWKGNYSSWAEAEKHCKGYDADNILEKVKSATTAVLAGKGAYERDSVIFQEHEYSFPLLSYLLLAHEVQGNRLNLVDFGGSLGSSFIQHRKFLDRLNNLKWNIVEQPKFVEAGREIFSNSKISFYNTIGQCIAEQGKPDMILISSTLPYLENPYEILRTIINHNFRFLAVDLTPFNYEDSDRITVQRVNPAIYDASYPCRFLSLKKLKEFLSEKYHIISEHFNDSVIYLDGKPVRYQGFLMELNL
ncbi:MAG: methyltransferase, TIGR04325 family [Chitinophagaceae bacterium]|nr:MAG: methyltransferase, TIGR04325 family [Chitinophagaceae bacterium]